MVVVPIAAPVLFDAYLLPAQVGLSKRALADVERCLFPYALCGEGKGGKVSVFGTLYLR
jgi:hypothetical protein